MSQRSARLDASKIHAHASPSENPDDFAASVALVLATGGDKRIWPNAATGRNKYGTMTRPAPHEISFSSTTASNISGPGFAAATYQLHRLFDAASQAAPADEWFGDIRQSIAHCLGLPGTEVVLAASGTDAELLTLGLMAALTKRPITNIFIAPDETGNGIPLAAGGHHFSDETALGIEVKAGELIDGLSPSGVRVRTIAIRSETGERRDQYEIDADLVAAVSEELCADRDILVHVLDISKTGLRGVTRDAARYVAGIEPGRVRVVIDACQLRSPTSLLRDYLADGFFVAVTGSKFAAGPPFAGALLIPAEVAQEIAAGGNLPAGLADYTAAMDWPDRLRTETGLAFKSEMNIGLGLRWVAALAHIAPYISVSESRQTVIKQRIASLVQSRAEDIPGVTLHPDDNGDNLVSSGIIPLTILDANGEFASLSEAQHVQVGLRNSSEGPVCHIGQPVRVESRTVLRFSASAYDIVRVSAGMDEGRSLDQALAPLIANLDLFFAKWSKLDRARKAL